MGWLTKISLVYLLLINLIAYGAMGLDKRKAKRHQWRIPESVLFTWVLLGGGFGGILGMHRFHHKTKHRSFRIGFPKYGAECCTSRTLFHMGKFWGLLNPFLVYQRKLKFI